MDDTLYRTLKKVEKLLAGETPNFIEAIRKINDGFSKCVTAFSNFAKANGIIVQNHYGLNSKMIYTDDVYVVQRKKHKKKRINKKWAKRYGYKIVWEKHDISKKG